MHGKPSRKPLYAHLYFQVLLAIAIGVALGYFRPATGAAMKPFGDGFIKLIKMMIAPVIFTTVTLGIAKAGDMRKVGRVGLKAIVYFEVISTIALVIGLLVVNVLRPGAGINADPNTLQQPKELTEALASGKNLSAVDLILHAIPDSAVGAFTGSDILQVLVVSILFGLALGRFGEQARPLVDLLDRFSHVLFGMIALIMHLAPLGAFGAMAFTVGKYGLGTLKSLGELMACVYLTCGLFIFVVLGIVARVAGFSLWQFLRYIKEEILLVLGTSSSETALPRMISKLENVGCAKSVVGLVIPTGYSFNLDGTSIYLTMATLFIAQATNVHLTLAEQIGVLAVLLLTSKGAAAVTGAGFITLAATLQTTGKVPVAGLALIFGIDRFMSEARSITNLIGNGVATMAVARWEGALDLPRARAVLAADTDLAADEPELLADAQAGFTVVPLEHAAAQTTNGR